MVRPKHHSLLFDSPPEALIKTRLAAGKLYAVGGYDGASRQCLSSVEVYDPVANRWCYVADMSTRRSGAGRLFKVFYLSVRLNMHGLQHN